jgi:hypothetical protein
LGNFVLTRAVTIMVNSGIVASRMKNPTNNRAP